MPASPLLSTRDPAPVGLRNPNGASPVLVICDHAGNAVPQALQGLGLPRDELDRHVAIDIGILPVSEHLSDLLDAPLVFQRYSRLVVESNRRLSSPDLIALSSDGTSVPGNAGLAADARQARIDEIFAPYHREIVRRLDDRAARTLPTVLVSMHSFTPCLRARPAPRPWHVGLCYGANDRFSCAVLDLLEADPALTVGRNEPYGINLTNSYSIPVYGEERGLPYAEIEIRQDLIEAEDGQKAWARRLAGVFGEALRRVAPTP